MNELVEQLLEGALAQSVEAEPAEDDDLVEIEEEILLPIPADFKDFLIHASHIVYGSLEPVTAHDSHLHTHLPEVTAQAWAEGLERDLIPLCAVGMGYYCVNQEGEVLLWQNGEMTDEYWESVWNWVERVWLES
ncbi:SMI1/KNR4 family protein [Aliikangiella sp. G2MR2-5]|uniref:SMI1/KNR4 family protein n=1 Tax=Aliikangiella sp. G2MR2-5 TaxID=2788943 RepID=UPI0018AB1E62|nr:SMI1/KNR4 family protein [Aliikangiella sp. G2MR2-5]